MSMETDERMKALIKREIIGGTAVVIFVILLYYFALSIRSYIDIDPNKVILLLAYRNLMMFVWPPVGVVSSFVGEFNL